MNKHDRRDVDSFTVVPRDDYWNSDQLDVVRAANAVDSAQMVSGWLGVYR